MTNAPHAITKLTLENFRNYRALTLEVAPHPVVLFGQNGAGKTNILEALSLLSPGRGLRGAKLRAMDKTTSPLAGEGWDGGGVRLDDGFTASPHLTSPARGEELPWVVAAEIMTRDTTTHIGTGRDGEARNEKRILKINGQRERKQSVLTQHISVQWLTPTMDQVFMEGSTARRKWLDRLTYSFDPEHATRVTAYEHAMRERNRLLADRGHADPYWLSILEQQMAEHAVAATLARLDAIHRIREAMVQMPSAFPHAELALQGTLEVWLGEGMRALDVETTLAERLRDLRGADALAGRTTEGMHRSHFQVMHCPKNRAVEYCSTGEQKAMLLAITLAAARARAAWCGLPPILLLDEVIAHLDVDKRGALFDLLRATAIQAWVTGTDAADFQGLEGFCTPLKITGGTVQVGVEKTLHRGLLKSE